MAPLIMDGDLLLVEPGNHWGTVEFSDFGIFRTELAAALKENEETKKAALHGLVKQILKTTSSLKTLLF